MSFATTGGLTQPLSGDAARTLPIPSKFGTAPMFSPTRNARTNVLRATEGTLAAEVWGDLLAEYDLDDLPLGPIDPVYIPNIYTDPEGYNEAVLIFRYDGIRALNFATRYQLTGDEAAATAAVAQLTAWADTDTWSVPGGSGTRLEWCCQWPHFLAAAVAIADSEAYTVELHNKLVAVTEASIPICTVAYTNANNWGDWGVVFEMACAVFLDDTDRFNRAVARWRTLLETSTDADNILTEEIYREGGGIGDGSSGLIYCDFGLQGKVFGAEWARANGVWLYDYVTPSGNTLQGVYEHIVGWMLNPETYPYDSSGGPPPTHVDISGSYEILHSLWPNADSADLLAEFRPTVDRRGGVRYLSMTHTDQRLCG